MIQFLLKFVVQIVVLITAVVFISPYLQHAATPRSLSNDSPPSCTVYASPSGNDANSGKNKELPKTLVGAAMAAHPGSVVCLIGGVYQLRSAFVPPRSGAPSAWIVYRSYGDVPVKLRWAGPADASPMVKLGDGKFPSGPAYLEFRGLELDGSGRAGDGFFCRGGHHLRFMDNTIRNTGGSGIGSIRCDYLITDHNLIDHNGYIPPDAGRYSKYYSWTSGISFNSSQWYDSYPGFHNVIANNIVAGQVDQSAKHTDGNGIILDLSNRTYQRDSANTPPALVVNNVVYGNGGRCIEAYIVTNFWFVNNTCYANNLDPSIGPSAAISVIDAEQGYVVNNIVQVRNRADQCYGEEKSTSHVQYFRNLCFGTTRNLMPRDSSQMLYADPLFVQPPYFHPTAAGQYAKAMAPSSLGDALMLQPGSAALARGIDPVALPNLSDAIVRDLGKYVYADLRGNLRPHAGNSDLGAYQRTTIP